MSNWTSFFAHLRNGFRKIIPKVEMELSINKEECKHDGPNWYSNEAIDNGHTIGLRIVGCPTCGKVWCEDYKL